MLTVVDIHPPHRQVRLCRLPATAQGSGPCTPKAKVQGRELQVERKAVKAEPQTVFTSYSAVL